MEAGDDSFLALRGLTLRRRSRSVLRDLNLDVPRGAFVTLLGPAAEANTSLLMSVAGLSRPAAGAIWLEGHDISRLAARRRRFGMVFRDSALSARLSVARNVGAPLRWKVRRAEAAQRVTQVLDLVGLAGYGDSLPAALTESGRRRAALARALAGAPEVILLDEPLAALQGAERTEFSDSLRDLHLRLGRTFLAAMTSAQDAAAASDYVAVLLEGGLVQYGSPATLYDHPRTAYVATLFGRGNLLRGTVREKWAGGGYVHIVAGQRLVQTVPDGPQPALGSPVLLCLRPERIQILAPGETADNLTRGVVQTLSTQGGTLALMLQTSLGPLHVSMPRWRARALPMAGDVLHIGWSAEAAVPLIDT